MYYPDINTNDADNLARYYAEKQNLERHHWESDIRIMTYPIVTDIHNGQQLHVEQVMHDIRSKSERQFVSHKEMLPIAYFSVTGFNGKKAVENIIGHSGLIIIDIDVKDNPGTDFNLLRKSLQRNTYTFACFRSPNGGIKLVVNTNIRSLEYHKAYYEAIRLYLLKHYKKLVVIDTTGSNASRGCFLPYDPNAYLNLHAAGFCLSEEYVREFSNENKSTASRTNSLNALLAVEHISYDEHFDNIMNLIKNRTSMGLSFNVNRTSVGKDNKFSSSETEVNNRTSMGNTEDTQTLIGQEGEKRTSVGLYDSIFNKYRYVSLGNCVMSTYVLFLEFLIIKNNHPTQLDFKTRLDEYYFNDNPQKPISTASIDGLDGMEVCEVNTKSNTVFREHYRAKTLSSITMKLIYNNPFCHPALIFKKVLRLNDLFSEDPNPKTNPKPDYKEVNSIVLNNYMKFIIGELDFSKVIRKKKSKDEISKRYMFRSRQYENTDPVFRHLEAVRTHNEGTRNKNLRLYAEAVNSLQDSSKITQKRIAEHMGMSTRNLRRYDTEDYDERIKKYNAALKNIKPNESLCI